MEASPFASGNSILTSPAPRMSLITGIPAARSMFRVELLKVGASASAAMPNMLEMSAAISLAFSIGGCGDEDSSIEILCLGYGLGYIAYERKRIAVLGYICFTAEVVPGHDPFPIHAEASLGAVS